MFCPACGTSNNDSARFCHSCGGAIAVEAAPQPAQTVRGAAAPTPAPPTATSVAPSATTQKSPGLALVLSLLIVGLGQFYNGDWKKGLAMLGGAIILGPLTAGVAWLGLAIWSMIDAYGVAKGTTKRW